MTSLRTLRPGRNRLLLAPTLAVGALCLTACGLVGSDDAASEDSGSGSDSDRTVTIEHAFGSTEIVGVPERVVALGWGSADAAIALDVVPVAVDAQTYGATENGLMPWVEEAVEERGAELPETLATGDSVDFDAILEADPDVVLATYSGISEADYDRLTAADIPVVAYPDGPWTTPWRDVITTTGEVLDKSDEAEQLLADLDTEVAEAAAAHPEFEGVSIAAVAIAPDNFYVYTGADPRVEFLTDLGFEVAPSVPELAGDEAESFFFILSPERLDQLSSDVLLNYVDNEEAKAVIDADPTYQAMPQFAEDRVAEIVGEATVSSVSPPTALSIGFSLDTFVDALAAAVPQQS